MNPIAKNLIKAAVAVGALKGAYKLGKIAGASAAYRQNQEYSEALKIAVTPHFSVEVGPGFVSATVANPHETEEGSDSENEFRANDEPMEDEDGNNPFNAFRSYPESVEGEA